MAIPFKNDDLTHIVRTTEQWETTADKYEIIPEGVLCVEFTPSDRTNIKIGNGHKTFRELPYVAGNIDLSLYYTREETDNRILSILNEQKVFRIKGYKKSFNELPVNGSEGDVWFVESTSPSEFNIYEKYIWTANNKWEFIGNSNIDIDLSQYAKKEDVENKFNDINLKLQEWVDTEKVHTHLNKEILDKTDAIFDKVKDDKLSSLTNYDDKEIRSKITDLEKTAHTHQNKDTLDKTTAPFTIEYERLMPFIREYVGASRFEDGEMGLVPPALAGEQDYILTGAGKWVPNTGGGVYELPIATKTELGGIKIGEGLEISEDGILSISGEISDETYRAGLGINIEEKPIPGDIELDILNNEYAGWDNFTYLWTGGAEYEETDYVLHTTRDRIADAEGNWLTHFKIPDGVENIKVEAVAKDGTPLKFWIDNHDSETLYRWSLLGRWYDSGETVIYPDEYVPSLLKYNYISIGLCFDTNNTRTISVDDIDYVKLYFIEGDPENLKGMGKYINSDIASEYQLGGVIIGKGINVTEDGVISVDSMPLEPATSETLGGIKVGNGLEITNDGTLNVTGGEGWNTPSTMAYNGYLYSYDSSQNATFPAKVTAAAFDGKINGKSYNEYAPTSTSTNIHRLLFYQSNTATTSGSVGTDEYCSYDTIQGVLRAPVVRAGVMKMTSRSYVLTISSNTLSADRAIKFPNASGTVSLEGHTHSNYSTTSHTHGVSLYSGSGSITSGLEKTTLKLSGNFSSYDYIVIYLKYNSSINVYATLMVPGYNDTWMNGILSYNPDAANSGAASTYTSVDTVGVYFNSATKGLTFNCRNSMVIYSVKGYKF